MKKLFIVTFTAMILSSCGGGSFSYEKSPVDKLLIAKSDLANYSIQLSDMDYDEPNDKYKHQYKIIYQPKENPDTLLVEKTDWYVVSDEFFQAHVNDLGMALVTVKNFVAEKQVSPPGYSDYVGNEKYGSWQQNSSGGSFWQFYGQYMFMTTMFRMMSPVSQGHYGDYRRHSSYGTPYYGSTGDGRTMYGTGSNQNSSSKWGSKPSTFKERVRSKVSQSASKSKSSRLFSRSSTRRGTATRRSYGGGFGK